LFSKFSKLSLDSFFSRISFTEIKPDVRVPVGDDKVLTSFLNEISPKEMLLGVLF